MKKQPKLCEKCKKNASTVGLTGVWLCLPCFEKGLQAVRELVEAEHESKARLIK